MLGEEDQSHFKSHIVKNSSSMKSLIKSTNAQSQASLMKKRSVKKIQMSQIGKKDVEKDLPQVTVELISPTSVSMKNSLMIKKSH